MLERPSYDACDHALDVGAGLRAVLRPQAVVLAAIPHRVGAFTTTLQRCSLPVFFAASKQVFSSSPAASDRSSASLRLPHCRGLARWVLSRLAPESIA